MTPCLTTCRFCCKFEKEDVYFAPKITAEEVACLKAKGVNTKVIHPFKKSKKVFQIALVPAKMTKGVFLCSYLDEKTHACKIYAHRPFDCAFWPFLLMYSEDKKKILIGHFEQDICAITGALSKKQFKDYVAKSLDQWLKKIDIKKLIVNYPELIWDYEPDVPTVKEIK